MDQANVTFALALPHTPWVPERVESFARLLGSLNANMGQWTERGVVCSRTGPAGSTLDAAHVRVFDEREPNRVWAQKMWRWAVGTGATHLVQLQDDVLVAPDFWRKLRAMVEAVPDQIIGLEQAHPIGPALAQKGDRWCRSLAWMVGPGWVWPLSPDLPCGLPRFLEWCDAHPEIVQASNEDDLVNVWAVGARVAIYHPIPTIIDHDTDVASTYGNDSHQLRRPTVLWGDYDDAAMGTREFWEPQADIATLASPYASVCWFCLSEPGPLASAATRARMGKQCLAKILGTVVGRL